jgi:hypothetical protein
MEQLMVRHCLLANDLFSFDKECSERDLSGTAIVNAVECLRTLMETSKGAAKSMAMTLLWEAEQQMHQVYEQGLWTWTDAQILYAQRMIELAAGNYFYSATAYRYSREAIRVHAEYASRINPSL